MDRSVILGIIIILVAIVMGVSSLGQPAIYQAESFDPNSSESLLGFSAYDSFEIDMDGRLSEALIEANRKEGELIYGRRYLSRGYNLCLEESFACPESEEVFFDSYGCGCQPLSRGSSLSQDNGDLESTPEESVALVQTVVWGQTIRLFTSGGLDLGSGNLLWLESFTDDPDDSLPPQAVMSIYLRASDKTLSFPSDQDEIPYIIRMVGSDFREYVEVIVEPKDTDTQRQATVDSLEVGVSDGEE